MPESIHNGMDMTAPNIHNHVSICNAYRNEVMNMAYIHPKMSIVDTPMIDLAVRFSVTAEPTSLGACNVLRLFRIDSHIESRATIIADAASPDMRLA